MSLSRPYSIDGDPNVRNLLNLRGILLDQRQRSTNEFVFGKTATTTTNQTETYACNKANPRLKEKFCPEVSNIYTLGRFCVSVRARVSVMFVHMCASV